MMIFALLLASTVSSAEDRLEDLSLEDLLDMRLGGMSISGIHHTHDRGEWMTGYSFMYMDMNGALQAFEWADLRAFG